MKEGIPILKLLVNIQPRSRRLKLYRLLEKELDKPIQEIIVNIVEGNIPLSPRDKNRLKRYKKEILTLYESNLSKKRKESIIFPQVGGGPIALLLPLAISTITSLLTR